MQILVVVASIQMIALKTEVEKGSVTTAIDYGLDDPKSLGNSSLGSCSELAQMQPMLERETG